MPPGARKQDDASVTESPSEATGPQQLQTQTQMQAVTIPAPASTTTTTAGRDRPTTIPDYDVQTIAAASVSFLGRGSSPLPGSPAPNALPLDLAIPIRKQRASVCGAPLRAAFLLSHVDDRMTIAEIAISAQLPLPDAIENFVLLADLGVVELRGSSQAPQAPVEDGSVQRPPTPKSGLRPKT